MDGVNYLDEIQLLIHQLANQRAETVMLRSLLETLIENKSPTIENNC